MQQLTIKSQRLIGIIIASKMIETSEQDYAEESAGEVQKSGSYGFKGRMFPLIGFIVGVISVFGSYYVARHKSPPDVKPFPQDDITHAGLKFPEYAIMRIGLMVAAPIFGISFQLLKNYLNMISFELTGEPAQSVKAFGWMSLVSCLSLAISTASMSDGGDMNWTLHVYCASQFFIITLLMISLASKEYRRLWVKNHFCNWWSYQVKKYANFVIFAFVLMQLLEILEVIEIYALVEWLATFFLMFFVLTLYWDLEKLNIMLVKKKGEQ